MPDDAVLPVEQAGQRDGRADDGEALPGRRRGGLARQPGERAEDGAGSRPRLRSVTTCR
ncbi:hypothetical protein [Actinomadura sp. CNU-125]|uniref:hypothetical protein n=1 Tax=Actinomadura sp. CNU-125 TaxID=1904961 RepID=UPI0021CC91C3|nr:hypothetical protein [Actinomadura sp. CNU-125]